MLAESQQTKGRLLSEVNKDLDQQKRLERQEAVRRELLASFSKVQSENQAEIVKLNKQVNPSLYNRQLVGKSAEI